VVSVFLFFLPLPFWMWDGWMVGLAGGGLVAFNYCILSAFYYRIEMGTAFDSHHGKEGQVATVRTVPAKTTGTWT
jgi:hypothetical protein